MNKSLFAAVIFVLLGSVCLAQESPTIQSLISRVLEQNYQILIVKNSQQIASNNNTLGNAGMLPTLDAQLTRSVSNNNIRNEYFTGVVRADPNATSNNFNTYAQLNWLVFDGFRMFARRDQLKMLEQSGELQTRFYIEQTVSDIADAWYQLVREHELLNNYFQTLDVSRYRLFLEKRKLDVGSGNGLLYNQALVDYNTDSLAIMNQRRMIRSLVIRINEIANLDPDAEYVPDDDLSTDILFGDRDSLVSRAVTSNREIQRSLIEEMIAETDIRLSRSNYYPEINIYGQLTYNKQTNEVGTVQYGKNFGRQAGVTVRFNLFNGFNDKRVVENSKILKENTTLEKEQITKQVTSAVYSNYYQYMAIAGQISVAEQNIVTAQKSLDIAKAQYEKGAISGFDFRETQLSVIRARNTASSLHYSLKSIEIELLRLTGEVVERLLD